MWKNSELKQNAKAVFSRYGYWLPLFVSLAASVLSASLYELVVSVTDNAGYETEAISFLSSGTMIFLFVFSLLWGIFVKYPILVGLNRFFMEHRLFGSSFKSLFWVFKSGNYLNVIKIMFLMNLKILLWSLLFIIPGIIKSYQYYMVPYILAENPNISAKRAFELSAEMTRDEKFNIFLLELSFIGWILLGSLACGIGLIFVNPYILATIAELYQVMRERVHSLGISDYSELPGFLPEET